MSHSRIMRYINEPFAVEGLTFGNGPDDFEKQGVHTKTSHGVKYDVIQKEELPTPLQV